MIESNEINRKKIKELEDHIKNREIDHHKVKVDYEHKVAEKDQSSKVQTDLIAQKKKLSKVRTWIRQREMNPDWCGEAPTAGLRERYSKKQHPKK